MAHNNMADVEDCVKVRRVTYFVTRRFTFPWSTIVHPFFYVWPDFDANVKFPGQPRWASTHCRNIFHIINRNAWLKSCGFAVARCQRQRSVALSFFMHPVRRASLVALVHNHVLRVHSVSCLQSRLFFARNRICSSRANAYVFRSLSRIFLFAIVYILCSPSCIF